MLTRKMLPVFVLLLFTAGSVRAQIYSWYEKSNAEITTDYNSCLVGVKDTLGNWIIQPVYEYMYSTSQGYIVYSGGRAGVIDEKGNYRIPIMYDYVRNIGNGWDLDNYWDGFYEVSLAGQFGVVDSTNNIVLPIRYQDIIGISDSTLLLKEGKKHWYVYHSNGKMYPLPWKSKEAPERALDRSFIIVRERFLRSHLYGIAGDTGQIIAERKYSNIQRNWSTQTFSVSRKGKTGFLAADGKVLWPMIFTYNPYSFWHFGYSKHLGNDEIAPIMLGENYGLVSVYGDTLLPFKYNSIRGFGSTSNSTLWEVDSSGYQGIYDSNNGWLVPLDTVSIIPMGGWTILPDSVGATLLITKRNNKWGAVMTTGQVILPFRYDRIFQSYPGQYIFYTGDTLMQMTMQGSYSRDHYIHAIATSSKDYYPDWDGEEKTNYLSQRNFSSFTGLDGVVAFYDPALTHDSVHTRDSSFMLAAGNYYSTPLPDSVILPASIYTRPLGKTRLEGKEVTNFGFLAIYERDTGSADPAVTLVRGDSTFRLTSIERSYYLDTGRAIYITGMGDIIRQDGKILVSGDTVGYLQMFHRGCDGVMYFADRYFSRKARFFDTSGTCVLQTSDHVQDFSDHYYWRSVPKKGTSQLVDSKTGAVLPAPGSEFLDYYPIWDSVTILEDITSGLRLYNIPQNKYLMKFGVNEIAPLDRGGNSFLLITCLGHLGVISSSGEMLIDTAYSVMCPVGFNSALWYGFSYEESGYDRITYLYNYWVFSNEDSYLVYDVEAGSVMSQETGRQFLADRTIITLSPDQYGNSLNDSFVDYTVYPRGTAVCYMRERDSTALTSWQKECIIDSLYSPAIAYRYTSQFKRYPCMHCYRKGVKYMDIKAFRAESTDQYILIYRSDSLVSFCEIEQYHYTLPVRNEYRDFSNVMMFPDGPHQLSIDSLFDPYSDWRNFIIDTVITYVNTHRDIEGDCHNPAMIPQSLQYRFQITTEGLILFPPGFEEDNYDLSMVLTWDVVGPYLRKDIKSRLPIDEKK